MFGQIPMTTVFIKQHLPLLGIHLLASIGASAWLILVDLLVNRQCGVCNFLQMETNFTFLVVATIRCMANLNTAWDVTTSSSSWDGTADYDLILVLKKMLQEDFYRRLIRSTFLPCRLSRRWHRPIR